MGCTLLITNALMTEILPISKLHSFATIQSFLLRYLTLSLVKWVRNGETSKFEVQKQKCLKKVHFTCLTGNNLNFSAIFWTCKCQGTSILVFQLKIKELQAQNWQKNSKYNLLD